MIFGEVAPVQDVQAVVLGEHRERVLEQPAAVVLEPGLLAVVVGSRSANSSPVFIDATNTCPSFGRTATAPGMTRSSPETVFGRG